MKRKGKILSVMLIIALLISFGPTSIKATDYVQPLEGLMVNKTAAVYGEPDADGRQIFKIDVTAQTESDIVVASVPCDIILVLDESGSMDDNLASSSYIALTEEPVTGRNYYVKVNGSYIRVSYNNNNKWIYRDNNNWKYVTWDANGDDNAEGGSNQSPTAKPFYIRIRTKMDALKYSANAFVQTVFEQSQESRIAVVSFATDAYNRTTGLVNVKSSGSVNNVITNAINGLNANGATHSNEGLGIAVDIFQNDDFTGRNRVVVMFTDGEPGNYGFDDNDGRRYAAAAINQSAVLKGVQGTAVNSDVTFDNRKAGNDIDRPRTAVNEPGCGATVYSIGVFGTNINNLTHRYMAWVSSDNDSSQSATSSDDYEYYFTADSADSLNDIFQEIAEETGQTIEDVVIKDYIDPRFNIVNSSGNVLNVGDSITVGSVTGIIKQDINGIYVEWLKDKIEPGTIAEGKGFKGSFYTKPKDDFIGGNVIPTNIENISALYAEGDNIASLPNPTINVPFKLNVTDIADEIFLGETVLKNPEQAQSNMINSDFTYPSGLLSYNWEPVFSADTKPAANNEYGLTVTATPVYYIDFSDTNVWTAIVEESVYKKSTGEIYYAPVGTEANTATDTGTYNITVKAGTLTINKSVSSNADANQTFVFEIKQYDDTAKTNLIKTFYETIRVADALNSRTVINLPKGYYEVKELSSWSWQYDLTSNNSVSDTLGMDISGTSDMSKTEASAGFTNASKTINHLYSIDWVLNEFAGGE